MVIEKGTILDGTYEVIGEIGSGGGGIVYRARHLRLQTDVVIKKIKEEVRQKVKLRQEVDILKQLKHPYLPRVYDFLETEDGVYTIMDFIQGENLDEVMKRHGKFPQKQVRKWAEQLGDVLAYLHSRTPAIIHSDIKPANIMLTENGDICLIDFNISLAAGAEEESTVGVSAGFSPPEQYKDPALYARVTRNYTLQKLSKAASKKEESTVLSDNLTEEERTVLLGNLSEQEKTMLLGDMADAEKTVLQNTALINEKKQNLPSYTVYMGRGIDTRSDIYSLGITLYYLLTGIEPPADFEQRVPVLDTNIEISEGFAIILEKMMALKPEERFQNGMEFYKAIVNCHKSDKRYILMKRKQTGIQLAAMISLLVGILLVFSGFYKLRQEENSRYVELIGQAQECMAGNDFDKADMLLDQAREMQESRISAYKEKVYLLYCKGSYEECTLLGEQYINTFPFLVKTDADSEELGDIYYIVGNAYFELDDDLNAAKYMEEALQHNNKNGLYYRDYAIAVAKMGQLDKAEELLQAGIELGISQDSVCMVQGEMAHVRGQFKEASQYLGQTITLTKDLQMKRRAVLLSVEVYQAMGEEAIDSEIALLEGFQSEFEKSGNLVITEYLADAYARKAQTDEAIAEEYYEKALALFLEISEKGYVTYQIKENMAILYENMDRFEEAENILLSMTEEYPKRYEVYKRLAYLEADQQQKKDNINRDYRKMQEYYEKSLELYDDNMQDTEMQMLTQMMQELKDGGWL